MIKLASLGMLDVAKNDPTITSQTATANYSFITSGGDIYLVAQNITGDDAYLEGAIIPAGEPLNCFMLEAWKGQKLIVDGKHVTYAQGKDYDDLAVDDLLTVAQDGTLEVAAQAPASGAYLKITKIDVTLTEPAFVAQVMVA